MRKIIILIIHLTWFLQIHSIGQQKMQPGDILEFYRETSQNQAHRNFIVDSDSTLSIQLLNLSDSLKEHKIDSLIIFSIAYPGYGSNSVCDTGIFPISTVVVWNHHGVTYLRCIQGACVSEFEKENLHFFDQSESQLRTLSSEIFMPVIFGGKKNKNGRITITLSGISHEPMYTFYFRINNRSNSYHFSESWLEDKRGMFWEHNTSLIAYNWWKIVTKTVQTLN